MTLGAARARFSIGTEKGGLKALSKKQRLAIWGRAVAERTLRFMWGFFIKKKKKKKNEKTNPTTQKEKK